MLSIDGKLALEYPQGLFRYSTENISRVQKICVMYIYIYTRVRLEVYLMSTFIIYIHVRLVVYI